MEEVGRPEAQGILLFLLSDLVSSNMVLGLAGASFGFRISDFEFRIRTCISDSDFAFRIGHLASTLNQG